MNRCFRKLLPWLVLGLIGWLLASGLLASKLSSNLKSDFSAQLAGDSVLKGVTVDKVNGQSIYMTGPASLEAQAVAAAKAKYGVVDYRYTATPDPAPPTTVAPATTVAAPTTVAPATTAAATTVPATTVPAPTTTKPAPTTTVAPAPTTVAPPATTAAPPTTVAPKACPSLPTLTGVNFETSSATLAADAPSVLAPVVSALKAAPGCKVSVIGHTDNRGSDESNQTLSEARAASVVNYLVSQGIPAANLTAIGKGESEPVAGSDQNTDAGLAVNRRIEFKPTNLGS